MTHQVQFIWHFHQPDYGLPGGERALLPWVRLHATKAYYDMGRLLEEHEGVAATINFSGVLLRQLRELVELGRRDAWWDLTLAHAGRLSVGQKRMLLRYFFSIDWDTCVRPHQRYAELLDRKSVM